MRHWSISRDKDGFRLHVTTRSSVGSALAWLIESADLEWWGKYHNLPFCWINPWGWTWKVGGTGENGEGSLGDKWCDIGNRVLHVAWKLQKDQELASFPLTEQDMQTQFAEEYKWFDYMLGDDEEDEDEEPPVPCTHREWKRAPGTDMMVCNLCGVPKSDD